MSTIRDIMTSNVKTVTTQDNVYEVAVLMKDHNIGAVPVVEGSKPIGIITDRDIVIRGIAERKSGSTAVQEVMTSDLITVTPDTSTEEAANMMAQKQIRRLLVVDGGNLVGIIALKDLTDQQHTSHLANKAIQEISESSGEHTRELH